MRNKDKQGRKNFISLNRLGHLSMLSLLIAISPLTAHADTLQMPAAATPKPYSVTLPGRGMTMTEVIEQFGEPQTKEPEVGEPPITRWIYPDFIVIFEYQYVIHALVPRKPMGMLPPKPANTTETTAAETDKPETPATETPSAGMKLAE